MGIILTACNNSNSSFCGLNILSDLKPHDNMQYCRWGRIKLLYKIFNIFWGKNRFNLHIIPSDLDILFDIFCTCPFHVKCWSIVKPKKSKSVTRLIICSFKFSCGIRFSMLRCLWWKMLCWTYKICTECCSTRLFRGPHTTRGAMSVSNIIAQWLNGFL